MIELWRKCVESKWMLLFWCFSCVYGQKSKSFDARRQACCYSEFNGTEVKKAHENYECFLPSLTSIILYTLLNSEDRKGQTKNGRLVAILYLRVFFMVFIGSIADVINSSH